MLTHLLSPLEIVSLFKVLLTLSSDAVASFLQTPDPTTIGKCLMQKDDLDSQNMGPRAWRPTSRFWHEAPSMRRWVTCMTLYANTVAYR